MSFLRPVVGFVGIFHCLLGMLVSGSVIFFSVVNGRYTMGVSREFVEFGRSLVRVVGHSFPILGDLPTLEAFQFSGCSIMHTHANHMVCACPSSAAILSLFSNVFISVQLHFFPMSSL